MGSVLFQAKAEYHRKTTLKITMTKHEDLRGGVGTIDKDNNYDNNTKKWD